MRSLLGIAAALVIATGCGASARSIPPSTSLTSTALATATPSPAAQPPSASAAETTCDPVPTVPSGERAVECGSAVRAAIEALPPEHPAVSVAAFHYDCPGGADCAVWKFGVVEITYATAPSERVIVRVELQADGRVKATIGPFPTFPLYSPRM